MAHTYFLFGREKLELEFMMVGKRAKSASTAIRSKV